MGKGRTPCCEKGRVKKGPWSQDEDLKLISFIQRHGHSNWRSLPRLAGLARCGKSCRLRWVNYLRPDVKRGSLSPDEEQTIIRLQSLFGNKWSKIASHLPGRTDNEIKNIWNTHLRKRSAQRKSNPKSTHHNDQDKVPCEPSSMSYEYHGNLLLHFHDQGLAPPTIPTKKDKAVVEPSCSDYHAMIDVARKIPYEEPNLVDLWDSLLLDDDGHGQDHILTPSTRSSMVLEGDASGNKKDLLAARSSCSWPVELLDNLELGKINNKTTTNIVNHGACHEFVEEQSMSKSNQVEAFSNSVPSMESYLEIMAWPSSPASYSTFYNL